MLDCRTIRLQILKFYRGIIHTVQFFRTDIIEQICHHIHIKRGCSTHKICRIHLDSISKCGRNILIHRHTACLKIRRNNAGTGTNNTDILELVILCLHKHRMMIDTCHLIAQKICRICIRFLTIDMHDIVLRLHVRDVIIRINLDAKRIHHLSCIKPVNTADITDGRCNSIIFQISLQAKCTRYRIRVREIMCL